MPQTEDTEEQISEFERAVRYYTLPRVVYPVTMGAICVFAVFLLQALAAISYGWLAENSEWFSRGLFFLCWLVGLGSVAFLAQAFLNEVRQRRTLNQAQGIPNPTGIEEDLPDPFSDHLLLRHPVAVRGEFFSCTNEERALMFFVDSAKERWLELGRSKKDTWNVRTAQDEEYCHIRIEGGPLSFSLDPALPGRLVVTKEGEVIARITSRFSFTAIHTEIKILQPEERAYSVRHQGIYYEEKLVGRLYNVRQSGYLDIKKDHFNEGILAYFLVWS
jgi:hypothetical protein